MNYPQAQRLLLKGIVFYLIFLYGNDYLAQEQKAEEKKSPYRHEIGLVLNHAQIFNGRDVNGHRSVLSLPAWSLDYTFHLSSKWALGLHTDIIVEKFKVEREFESGKKDDIIERSYPVAPALMGIYKTNKHWSFLLGMGGEFAKEANFVLTRAGAEYAAEISENWEVFGTVSYDFKWDAYDTWSLGIGISKILFK